MQTLFRDRLPKGLTFPLGQETLSSGIPALEALSPAVLFTWQSTWASQLYNPTEGQDGQLSILHLLREMPVMRINGDKVRDRPPACQIVIAEYAVSSKHRRRVLDAFLQSGSGLVSRSLIDWPFASRGVRFDLATNAFIVPGAPTSAHGRPAS